MAKASASGAADMWNDRRQLSLVESYLWLKKKKKKRGGGGGGEGALKGNDRW